MIVTGFPQGKRIRAGYDVTKRDGGLGMNVNMLPEISCGKALGRSPDPPQDLGHNLPLVIFMTKCD